MTIDRSTLKIFMYVQEKKGFLKKIKRRKSFVRKLELKLVKKQIYCAVVKRIRAEKVSHFDPWALCWKLVGICDYLVVVTFLNIFSLVHFSIKKISQFTSVYS